MTRNIFIWVIFCGCVCLTNAVKVSVYYESLCPYSVAFLINQFSPAYNNIRDKIETDLIPFGKANITNDSGKWSFTCQHGERECYGNKIQSCALALYPLETSIQYVLCAMGSSDASLDENLERCSTQTNIPWTAIQTCLNSGQADELLVANGERTYAVTPKITGIPTIIFNDVFSAALNSMARSNLQSVVEFLAEEELCGGCHLNAGNKITRSDRYVFGLAILTIVLQKILFK